MKGQRTIVSWYFKGPMSEFALNTKVGQAFLAPVDYWPRGVRIHAEGASAGTQVIANILDDGVSIYPDTNVSLPRLALNSTIGRSGNLSNAGRIREGSVVTLQFTSLGTDQYASGVTVQLELEEA